MAAVLLGTARAAAGGSRPFVEARLGNAWNARVPVTIRQPGAPTLHFTARFETRGFETPLWYGARIGRRSGELSWALDLLHHKLFLRDPPPEVGSFSISHGYNLLTLRRAVERGGWSRGIGVGVVLAHPESEVRGRMLDEKRGLFRDGYFVAGPTLAAFAGRSLELGPHVRAGVELALTVSHAEVPVAGGWARVPNLAVHASLGLGGEK